MGPWDVMSSHYIDKKGPPPGLSSFTKIRLGWISAKQVVQVLPGQTREVMLWPLAEKGPVLAVKIPLPGDEYYLVENRQPINYDKILPDSGILVIRVDSRSEAVISSSLLSSLNKKLSKMGRVFLELITLLTFCK